MEVCLWIWVCISQLGPLKHLNWGTTVVFPLSADICLYSCFLIFFFMFSVLHVKGTLFQSSVMVSVTSNSLFPFEAAFKVLKSRLGPPFPFPDSQGRLCYCNIPVQAKELSSPGPHPFPVNCNWDWVFKILSFSLLYYFLFYLHYILQAHSPHLFGLITHIPICEFFDPPTLVIVSVVELCCYSVPGAVYLCRQLHEICISQHDHAWGSCSDLEEPVPSLPET